MSCPSIFSSQMGTSHCLRRYSCPSCWWCCIHGSFSNRNTFLLLLKSLEIFIYSCGAGELRSFIRANLTWPLDIIAWPFYRCVVKFLWQSQRPTESETVLAACLRAFFGPSTLFLNRHVGETIVPWTVSYHMSRDGLCTLGCLLWSEDSWILIRTRYSPLLSGR